MYRGGRCGGHVGVFAGNLGAGRNSAASERSAEHRHDTGSSALGVVAFSNDDNARSHDIDSSARGVACTDDNNARSHDTGDGRDHRASKRVQEKEGREDDRTPLDAQAVRALRRVRQDVLNPLRLLNGRLPLNVQFFRRQTHTDNPATVGGWGEIGRSPWCLGVLGRTKKTMRSSLILSE
jgi:hypothetical protein